jgi:hypothetical protein
MSVTWPPTLDELKDDLKIALDDTTEDVRLTMDLDASIAFVQRVRSDVQYDPLNPDQLGLPGPDADLKLGTLRLAGRWNTRRRSPDAMIAMAELGTARVSSYDPDIDRMLRIGRYAPMAFA